MNNVPAIMNPRLISSGLHQYIDRETASVRNEQLYGDRVVNYLYSAVREKAPLLFTAFTSSSISYLVGLWNYDVPFGPAGSGVSSFCRKLGIDLSECVDDPATFDSPRKVFERKIRYWERRPMDSGTSALVSPADAKLLLGSLQTSSQLFLKGNFFDVYELLGQEKTSWHRTFQDGDFAIFRLTPDEYHYNHTPVSGVVVDCYEVDGTYHSCNPGPIISVVTPYSKNKRVVTVIDTDVPGGTQAGLVAMIEIVALMIGAIDQRYSERFYDDPQKMEAGLFVKKGQPKSLYRPGSSTDVLLFQRGRVDFCQDLRLNQLRRDAVSRYSLGFGRPAVETAVKVRSTIGRALPGGQPREADNHRGLSLHVP